MATYDELLTIANATGGTLINRIMVATAVAAEKVRVEARATPPTAAQANRLAWARQTLKDPAAVGRDMVWPVLTQNRAFTAAQITGATDATVQTAVDAAVDVLAGN
jgi:hypothetical protein